VVTRKSVQTRRTHRWGRTCGGAGHCRRSTQESSCFPFRDMRLALGTRPMLQGSDGGEGLGKGVEWWQHKALCQAKAWAKAARRARHGKRAWSAAMHPHHLQDMDREQIKNGAQSDGLHKRSGRRGGEGRTMFFDWQRERGAAVLFPFVGWGHVDPTPQARCPWWCAPPPNGLPLTLSACCRRPSATTSGSPVQPWPLGSLHGPLWLGEPCYIWLPPVPGMVTRTGRPW
jgi:hypothetical protein